MDDDSRDGCLASEEDRLWKAFDATHSEADCAALQLFYDPIAVSLSWGMARKTRCPDEFEMEFLRAAHKELERIFCPRPAKWRTWNPKRNDGRLKRWSWVWWRIRWAILTARSSVEINIGRKKRIDPLLAMEPAVRLEDPVDHLLDFTRSARVRVVLSLRERQVLYLIHGCGYTQAEAAANLGCVRQTVIRAHKAAIRKLRREFSREEIVDALL